MNRRDNLRAWGALAALGRLSGRLKLAELARIGGAAWLVTAAGARAQAEDDAGALLRAGACVVMLRHAQTDPGIGDPPEFDIAQCRTQRNLSESGRAQARRIGEWFKTRQLQPRAVQSSAWCRCKDTAELAFGQHTVMPALSSTFASSDAQPGQTQALRTLLAAVPPGQFEVWVTHQVNITALTGKGASMGEAIIVNTRGSALLDTRFA